MSRDDLPKEPPANEVTSECAYQRRREFIKNAGLFALTAGGIGYGLNLLGGRSRPTPKGSAVVLPPAPARQEAATTGGRDTDKPIAAADGSLTVDKSTELAGKEEQTPYSSVTTYNNYYEFGTDKSDPAENAYTLKPRPWTIAVEGEVKKPQTIDIDTLLRWFPLEERIYRMRCVEAWSMVIPWVGFPLKSLIERLEPTSRAKYIGFRTLVDLQQMPQQSRRALQWPYSEGLRIDEATHPLTLLAVGLYGKVLPNQNGAPIRLVVPWKYGFKGIKAIVKIVFTEQQPMTSWNQQAPNEYGFYANVNPVVDHPRWTQKNERRVGEFRRRATLPFNGYGEQVANLYTGMDLAKNY